MGAARRARDRQALQAGRLEVSVRERAIEEYNHGEPRKRAVDCNYDDGGAVGT